MGRKKLIEDEKMVGGFIAPHPRSLDRLFRERYDLSPGFMDVVVTGPAGGRAYPSLGNNAFREYVRAVLLTNEYEHNRRKECRSLISNIVEKWMSLGGKFVQRVEGGFVLAPRVSCLRLTKHLANRFHRNMKKEREAIKGLIMLSTERHEGVSSNIGVQTREGESHG
mmetsp:Transcript_24536/g.41715  ORF Transcript_24536/g.41715 Transcript_24536/m.41715 type:complete len:167 (-) Transcript_24536:2525-3025(-)